MSAAAATIARRGDGEGEVGMERAPRGGGDGVRRPAGRGSVANIEYNIVYYKRGRSRRDAAATLYVIAAPGAL